MIDIYEKPFESDAFRNMAMSDLVGEISNNKIEKRNSNLIPFLLSIQKFCIDEKDMTPENVWLVYTSSYNANILLVKQYPHYPKYHIYSNVYNHFYTKKQINEKTHPTMLINNSYIGEAHIPFFFSCSFLNHGKIFLLHDDMLKAISSSAISINEKSYTIQYIFNRFNHKDIVRSFFIGQHNLNFSPYIYNQYKKKKTKDSADQNLTSIKNFGVFFLKLLKLCDDTMFVNIPQMKKFIAMRKSMESNLLSSADRMFIQHVLFEVVYKSKEFDASEFLKNCADVAFLNKNAV